MNYQESIEPITTLKTQPAKLILRIKKTRQPIVVTQNGKATAILQDIESYERQRRALLLLKLASQGDEGYRAGRTLSHDQVKNRIKRKIKT